MRTKKLLKKDLNESTKIKYMGKTKICKILGMKMKVRKIFHNELLVFSPL